MYKTRLESQATNYPRKRVNSSESRTLPFLAYRLDVLFR